MRAALLLVFACTRANPAYYPMDAGASVEPSPDAAAPALVPPDAAPAVVPPDAAPPMADATAPAIDAESSSDAVNPLVFTDEAPSGSVSPPNPGGEDFEDPCGTGQVLIGVRGSSGANLVGGASLPGVNSVQGRCADVVTAGKPTGFGTGSARSLAVHGTLGPQRQDGTCPADQVVVGFEATTGQWIDAMYVRCAPVFYDGSSATLSVGPATRLPVRLGQPETGPFQTISCDVGKVAVGIRGGSGSALDWFSLRCARPGPR